MSGKYPPDETVAVVAQVVGLANVLLRELSRIEPANAEEGECLDKAAQAARLLRFALGEALSKRRDNVDARRPD